MHADRDEHSLAPVVSLSLGDSCVFRFGNPDTRGKPWTDVELESGDAFVFGGASRLAYHGVPRIRPDTGDPGTGLRNGRLNITLRESGLDKPDLGEPELGQPELGQPELGQPELGGEGTAAAGSAPGQGSGPGAGA